MTGSSPRLRGTRPGVGHGDADYRFIPAPAGNTHTPPATAAVVSVHPRACGEHMIDAGYESIADGSSPRLRGTLARMPFDRWRRRFIPAPAGNTTGSRPACCFCTVHPRACGEHGIDPIRYSCPGGSSPRLRGTLVAAHLRLVGLRFIPAPAGNTVLNSTPSTVQPVHPRACGEHEGKTLCLLCPGGSSPRLRGTPRQGCRICTRRRFIPAPAGNTFRPTSFSTSSPVHPRACGEHFYSFCCSLSVHGSSPRLRGTLTKN